MSTWLCHHGGVGRGNKRIVVSPNAEELPEAPARMEASPAVNQLTTFTSPILQPAPLATTFNSDIEQGVSSSFHTDVDLGASTAFSTDVVLGRSNTFGNLR